MIRNSSPFNSLLSNRQLNRIGKLNTCLRDKRGWNTLSGGGGERKRGREGEGGGKKEGGEGKYGDGDNNHKIIIIKL